MIRITVCWTVIILGLGMGCQNDQLDKELVAAHDRFRKALEETDSVTLFKMSPKDFQQTMQTRFVEWSKMAQSVKAAYSETLRRDVLGRLKVSLLDGVTDGQSLFRSMLDLSKRPDSEQVTYGLDAVRTHIDGSRGTVTTRAGETFEFVREDDEWKCLLFPKQFRQNSSWNSLVENIETAKHNVTIWKDSQFESISETDPIGQTNVLLHAINKRNHTAIFRTLDAPSQELIRKGWLKTRHLLALLAKRVADRKVKRQLLKTNKLSWVLRVRDELSFFAALWDDGRVTRALSVSLATQVQCARVGPEGGTIVVIANGARKPQQCESGIPLLFRPDSKGVQRLASLKASLTKFGLKPIDTQLAELLKTPTATRPEASEPAVKAP